MEPIKLKPAFKDYLWGGTRLRDDFGKDCDFEKIAESWEILPKAVSLFCEGRIKINGNKTEII